MKKRCQELDAEIEAELGIEGKDYEENFAPRGSAGSQEIKEITAKAAQPQARRPPNGKTHGDESMKQLERIRIPVFAGNKMNFQRWHAAFTCCVDLTPLTPQFKMLRLEASCWRSCGNYQRSGVFAGGLRSSESKIGTKIRR